MKTKDFSTHFRLTAAQESFRAALVHITAGAQARKIGTVEKCRPRTKTVKGMTAKECNPVYEYEGSHRSMLLKRRRVPVSSGCVSHIPHRRRLASGSSLRRRLSVTGVSLRGQK